MKATLDPVEREAARQRALVAALVAPANAGLRPDGCAERGERLALGLDAYRANAAASAERALGAMFPTVRRAVGDATFAALAREHGREAPPVLGDLGEWGGDFAAWLESRPTLRPWPWLPDCARLDAAVHRCERAADAALDAGSLSLLEAMAPERVTLRVSPGAAVVRSPWPIATLHAAHRGPDEPDLAAMRAALDARRGEAVLVVREGWRAAVHALDEPTGAFVETLLEGRPLGTALQRAGERFDFAAWLAGALRGGWLQGAVAIDPERPRQFA